MSLQKAVANALSFAHLAGLGRAKGAARAEDDEDKKPKKDDGDDEPSAEDDKPADGDDDDEDKKPKSKKAKAKAKAEDDGDEEPDGDEDKAAAERSRCKAIVAHGFKTGREIEACTFAFDTSMSAAAAVATLDALAAAAPKKFATASLSERMAGAAVPVVKPEAQRSEGLPDDKAAVGMAVKAIQAAAAKARGEA